jgi:hypothetical protein
MITMHRKLKLAHGYKDDTPGPGSYMHFSEFGVWVPKNYDGYVRKRIKSANTSLYNDKNRRSFRNKLLRVNTETNNNINKKGRIITAKR